MTRVIYDPSASSIVVDLLLEAADAKSSLLIPVVLDTGASLTIVATDIMAQSFRSCVFYPIQNPKPVVSDLEPSQIQNLS